MRNLQVANIWEITPTLAFPGPDNVFRYPATETTDIHTEENGLLVVEVDGKTQAFFAPGHWKYLRLVKEAE